MLALLATTLILMQNLLPNPSFEQVANGRPVGWSPQTWSGRANFGISEDARTGNVAIVVESTAGADAGWQLNVPVRPYSEYRLTAWIKTIDVEPVGTTSRGQGALINLHSRPDHTRAITGTTDWTQVDMQISTGASDALQINCILGYYGQAKGRALFDDVTLELLSTREIDPKATIDIQRRYQPISKYIYSQFIEHLGRCIYGGIWAEMLEDRKFFHPVNANESPWKGQAVMVAEDPFVGDHTPRVQGELRQDALWFEKGREYVGYVWLNGDGAPRDVDVEVGGHRLRAKAPARGWAKTEFRFRAPADTREGAFVVRCNAVARVGTASLMPADNVAGMRRDTLELLKELDAPLYRWPGGNFVSGYDWRDGIGDRDRRPPRKNPAWQGIEHNDFGTHEFLEFCRELGTEPLIVVNTGFGDAHSAAAWLQYVNGPASTEEGTRRVRNGRRAPWGVTWWGIGNEMYGPWQLGHMALDQYVVKHNIFFDRMMKVDPTIKTIAVGDLGFGEWSKGMLTHSVNQMDLLSEHFYTQERPGVMAHVEQVPNAIRAKVEAHRRYRETLPTLKGKDIRIAMDEWNYWYGPHVFGELGTRYFMKDALGIAAGLHEFYKSTDIVEMAQYAQTVNVIGAIKTTPTRAAFETTGLVLKLYRREFGTIPVAVEGTPEPLYVSAALTADRQALTIGVVNPTGGPVTLPLTFAGNPRLEPSKAWRIAHPDPQAHNDPETPDVVQIVEVNPGSAERLELPAYSITLVRYAIR
jgi:alpha-L-arabinofuranosidase